MTIDPTDNNLLASLRTTSEIVKINRQTGEVMWRLGGKENQFTFVGEHAENAPYYTVGQHDIHRLANGNLLYFDNGNISGGGVTPSDRTYSRAVEYPVGRGQQDRHPGVGISPYPGHLGPLHRFGQTIRQRQHPHRLGLRHATSGNHRHGGSPGGQRRLRDVIPECRSDGIHDETSVEHPGPGPWGYLSGHRQGQIYASTNAGVSVTVNSLTGTAPNQLVVQKHDDAARFPKFPGKAPQVMM